MVTLEEWKNIRKLLDNGFSISQTAREFKRSLPTIYRLLKNNGPKNHRNDTNLPIPKKVINYTHYLHLRIKKGVTNVKKLYQELIEKGYKGSYSSLNRYINLFLESNKSKNYRPSIRFETKPGEQAQVDWGECGHIEVNSKRQKLYCFIYILGFSREAYVEFTIRQNLQTLQECHIHAFNKLGIPKTILYDNPKTIVLKRKQVLGNERIYYNLSFLDFAQFYNFQIKLSPVYWPRTKGKVESGVNYVKNNFMQGMESGRDFKTLEELNKMGQLWLDTIANTRKHGTTGERPTDRYLKEKTYLQFPQKSRPYPTSPFLVRNSTKDAWFQYKSNFYSVPSDFARRKLLVKEINKSGIQSLDIYFEDRIIASHILSSGRGKLIVNEEHLISEPILKGENIVATKIKDKLTIPTPQVVTRSMDYYKQLIK